MPVEIGGVSVTVDRDFNRAMRLFSKKVQESGRIKEVRDRMYYEPPSVIKQRKKKMAVARTRRENAMRDRNEF